MGFTSCGRENEQSCQDYMNQNMVGIDYYVPWTQLAMVYIEVSKAGYVNYQLPEKILVPRGYTPYIIQVRGGINFVPAEQPDLVWTAAVMNSNLGQLKTADGSPVKAIIRFNVEPATLSSDSTSYGIPVPTEADSNTVLDPPQGFEFYLINAPINYDSYITGFEIYASAAGNVSLKTSTFYGCQIGESESCIDMLVNYQLLHSAYWAGMTSNGLAEVATLTLQEGYNSITLPRPLFAQRKSVLTLSPQEGQVALQKVDVPVSDLNVRQDSDGRYQRVSTDPNEAFLVSATAMYFDGSK